MKGSPIIADIKAASGNDFRAIYNGIRQTKADSNGKLNRAVLLANIRKAAKLRKPLDNPS